MREDPIDCGRLKKKVGFKIRFALSMQKRKRKKEGGRGGELGGAITLIEIRKKEFWSYKGIISDLKISGNVFQNNVFRRKTFPFSYQIGCFKREEGGKVPLGNQ